MANASFSNFAGVTPVPFVAGGTIIKDTFVKLDTTEGQVVQATAATDVVLGVALDAAVSGDGVRVQIAGIAVLITNGTLTLGAEVECAADGEATTAGGATAHSIGIALQAAASDQDKVAVLLALPGVKRPPNS